LSPQTNEDSLYRQERYRQSGVRCLWLFRRLGFPVSKDFPAVCIGGDITTGFEAHLGGQAMPLDEFLDAVFAGRFRYDITLGAKANVRVHGSLASLKGAATPFVTFIDVAVGPHPFRLMARERNDFPDLFASCEERILKAFSIKPMSVFDHGHLHIEKATLVEFQITISERWIKAIESVGGDGWGVFAPDA
jgi:hypothetical protein